jgi:hypothetical protein
MAPSSPHALANELSRLSTDEEKKAAVVSYVNNLDVDTSKSTQDLRPGRDNQSDPCSIPDPELERQLFEILKKHNLMSWFYETFIKTKDLGSFPAIERLPCAHVQVKKQWNCPNEGKLVCGNCRLVGYCSKVRIRAKYCSRLN